MKVELGRGERAFWIVLFAAVVAHLLAYALLAYPAMPQTVPTHWGADGAVDGWGDKAGTLFMAAMPLVLALVMLAVPRLDPKGRNFERFRGVYLGMSAALTLFMVAVAWMTPLTAFGLVPEGCSLVSTIILFALGALQAHHRRGEGHEKVDVGVIGRRPIGVASKQSYAVILASVSASALYLSAAATTACRISSIV